MSTVRRGRPAAEHGLGIVATHPRSGPVCPTPAPAWRERRGDTPGSLRAGHGRALRPSWPSPRQLGAAAWRWCASPHAGRCVGRRAVATRRRRAGRSVVTRQHPHRARAACRWHAARPGSPRTPPPPDPRLATPERCRPRGAGSAPGAPAPPAGRRCGHHHRPEPASGACLPRLARPCGRGSSATPERAIPPTAIAPALPGGPGLRVASTSRAGAGPHASSAWRARGSPCRGGREHARPPSGHTRGGRTRG